MNNQNDLELSILSCLLQKPELMEEVILEDKHFKNSYKLWKFMQSFYKKFHNFDITLMCSVVDKRYKLIDYIKVLVDLEPNPNLFKEYQTQLLNLFLDTEKDKYIIGKVFGLANDLVARNVPTSDFRTMVDEIYENADKLF